MCERRAMEWTERRTEPRTRGSWTTVVPAMILLAWATGALPAQQMDAAGVSYEIAPDPTLEATVGFPILLNDLRTIFVNSFGYERVEYDFDAWDFQAGRSGSREVFHSISYTLVYIQRIGERWTLLSFVSTGLSSDFGSRVSIDDFGMTIQASAQAEITDTFQLGGGLLYPIGAPFPYPVVLVDWDITERLAFVGYLPVYASLDLEAADFLDVGFTAEADFRSYHGDPDKYGVDNPQFSIITAKAGPYARASIGEWVHLKIEWGYYFLRLFSFLDGSDERESKAADGAITFKTSLTVGL